MTRVTLGNALFHLKQKKSWFFVGEPVQICIEGQFTVDLNDGLPNPLQNVVHGDVALIGELGVKVNSGPKNLKKSRPKKLVKSNKSITTINF